VAGRRARPLDAASPRPHTSPEQKEVIMSDVMDGAFGRITIHEEEDGEQDRSGTIDLFARLIKTGLAWTLQDRIGWTAAEFIQFGWITPAGEITAEGTEYAAGPPGWPS
jgi:hypothetical protein